MWQRKMQPHLLLTEKICQQMDEQRGKHNCLERTRATNKTRNKHGKTSGCAVACRTMRAEQDITKLNTPCNNCKPNVAKKGDTCGKKKARMQRRCAKQTGVCKKNRAKMWKTATRVAKFAVQHRLFAQVLPAKTLQILHHGWQLLPEGQQKNTAWLPKWRTRRALFAMFVCKRALFFAQIWHTGMGFCIA